jgi:hypothetical protein
MENRTESCCFWDHFIIHCLLEIVRNRVLKKVKRTDSCFTVACRSIYLCTKFRRNRSSRLGMHKKQTNVQKYINIFIYKDIDLITYKEYKQKHTHCRNQSNAYATNTHR